MIYKFRAWDGRQMQNGFNISAYNGDVFSGAGYEKDWPLMQFTGLVDKKGVDIYEGDIVVTPKGICAVTFELGCFYTITVSRYRLGGWGNNIEVIGNIYQNPELIPDAEIMK